MSTDAIENDRRTTTQRKMPESAATAGQIAAVTDAYQIPPDAEIIRSAQWNVKRLVGVVITLRRGRVAEKPTIGLVFRL
jgi:hypothetical protein